MNICENLLTEAAKETADFRKRENEETAYREPAYNIFHALKITSDEVRMCRFLADLLSPNGEHGCRTLFLKSFLQEVLGDVVQNKEICGDDTLLMRTTVETEFRIDRERRIDIVIRNSQIFIPMEVKIYAGDQQSQCYDYYNYMEGHYAERSTKIVYLTPLGTEPDSCSLQSREFDESLPMDKVKCISWADNICRWLKKRLSDNALSKKENLKSYICQYIAAIQSFANGKEQKMIKEIAGILTKSSDYFDAGLQVEKSMNEAKAELIRRVFDQFEKEMEVIISRHPRHGLSLYKGKTEKLSYDCAYSDYAKDNACDGLNYVVTSATFDCNKDLQLWFRIELEENLFAGFYIYDTKNSQGESAVGSAVQNIGDKLADEVAKYLNGEVMKDRPKGWGWCVESWNTDGSSYRESSEAFPNFKSMNPAAVKLADEDNLEQFVKESVENFEKKILSLLK